MSAVPFEVYPQKNPSISVSVPGVATETTLQTVATNTTQPILIDGDIIDLNTLSVTNSAFQTFYAAIGGEKKFTFKNDSGHSFLLGINGVKKGSIEKGFNGEGELDIALTAGQTVGLKLVLIGGDTSPTTTGQFGFNFFK